MNKRKLGRTNLHVSELCLNAAKFGRIDDESTSMALLDAYYACGGSFIQSAGFCANATVTPIGDSTSENVVGRWHQARGIKRDGLVLATRMALFRPAHGGSIAFTNLIREACERSLRRLRTSHLDFLICEWNEHLLPLDDVIDAVDLLIRAGLVRHAVAGGFPPWRVVDALHRACVRNRARFEAVQPEYSLLTRTGFGDEALHVCREHRMGFLARSPLAGGVLARPPTPNRENTNLDRSWAYERSWNQTGDAVLRVLAGVARKRLASPAQIALAWVLRNPQVTSTMISPMNADALRELARAAQIILSDDEAGALANATAVEDHRMELRHA
jgi:aryl-alcohol dehydrogenase-like predicted oxidoreductase